MTLSIITPMVMVDTSKKLSLNYGNNKEIR